MNDRELDSYTDEELEALGAIELSQLGIAAEERAWALLLEHQANGEAVPEAVRRRFEHLSGLAQRFNRLGREAFRRQADERSDQG
jgi:hypothetical protein